MNIDSDLDSDISFSNLEKRALLFNLKPWVPGKLDDYRETYAIKDYRDALPNMTDRDARFLMAKVAEHMTLDCRQSLTDADQVTMQEIRQVIDNYLIDIITRTQEK